MVNYFDVLTLSRKDNFSVYEFLGSIQNEGEKGFYQESLFNTHFVIWSKSNSRLVPSGGNFSAGNVLSEKFDIHDFIKQNIRKGADISDLTMIDYENKKLIVFSSKCKKKYGGHKMDISKIKEMYDKYKNNKYKDFDLEIRLVVDDKNKFYDNMKNQRDTTPDRSKYMLYDWSNIQEYINKFEGDTSSINRFISLYNSKYITIRPRFGQYIVSMTTKELLKSHKKIINGSICRFGKTYCMAYDILHSTCNLFIFITSQPKTIKSISSIFEKYDDFKDYQVFNFNNNNKKDIIEFNKIKEIKEKTIIFVSIHTLKSKGKGKIIKNIKNFTPMCLIDEFHQHGTTYSTLKVMEKHKLINSYTVFYSATYEKIKLFYRIPNEAIIAWGIEDNIWCSDVKSNIDYIKKKYGDIIVDKALKRYSIREIEEHYSKLPRLKFIIDKPSQKCLEGFYIKNKTDKSLGYSFDAVKMIKKVIINDIEQYKLVNEEAVISYFQHMLGEGIYDEAFGVYISKPGIIDNIYKKLCDKDGQKYGKIIPIYMMDGIVEGEQKKDNETIIYNCVECIIELLKKYEKTKLKGLENYELINYNTKTRDPEKWFDKIVEENPEKTIILFLGSSLTTGITNKYCDLLKLTKNINSYDLFWQTICRAMNESVERNKKFAYICIDGYQSLGGLLNVVKNMKYTGESEQQAWKRLMKQNIFNIVDVDYDGKFVDTQVNEYLFENIYKLVRNATPYKNNLQRYVEGFNLDNIGMISQYLIKLSKELSKNNGHSKLQELVDKLDEVKTDEIKDGIEIEKIKKEIEEKKEEVEKNDIESCIEMLNVLLTTYVLLTYKINNIKINDVIDYLKETNTFCTLIKRCSISFGLEPESAEKTIIKLNDILINKDNMHICNEVLETLKEQLSFNNNKRECYELCQEVIITTDIERKNNAEVLTPILIALEMILKIPESFWENMDITCLPKIFDPCVGKGVFVSLLFDFLFVKLEKIISDEEERRKTILEKIIYFADINLFNIHVTKMILDPTNKYKLNYYTGDTLILDITQTRENWIGVDKFDIGITNPPYSTDPSEQKTKPLYNLFIQKYIDICDYLLFIVPSRWFSGGKGLDKFRKYMLNRSDIKLIKHYENASDIFGNNISIEGGVNYFLKDKNYKGLCNFNGINIQLNKYDILSEPKYMPIIDKIINLESILDIYLGRNYYRIETNDKRLLSDNKEGSLICYVSSLKSKDRKKYIDNYDISEKNHWKVITAEANGSKKCFGFMTIINPSNVYTSSYIGFRVSSKKEGKYLISYLQCKLPNFLLASRKISQHINTSVVKWIPMVPLNKYWTDSEVYNYFNLSKEEIDIIEKSNIQYFKNVVERFDESSSDESSSDESSSNEDSSSDEE